MSAPVACGSFALGLFAGLFVGLLWLRSGRDPLWWLIRALIVLRAALGLAGAVGYRAALAWWRALPRAIEQARAEVVG